MLPQGFSDEFAEQTFEMMAKEIEKNVGEMPSDLLGRMILPMLTEASSAGRTRTIRLRALGLLKVVITAITKRDDCAIVAQNRGAEAGEPTEEEMQKLLATSKAGGENGLSLILDAIEAKIMEEEKSATAFENVSMNDILSAPMHPDAVGK